MVPILNFMEFVLQALLTIAVWVVILYAVLSWLVGFNVINMRNRAVYQITHALERVARPLLSPFQRFLPSFGGLDFSPVLFIIIVEGLQRFIIPPLFDSLRGLFGGTYAI